MTVEVTLTLPDTFLAQAQQWAGLQQRDVTIVLAEALEKSQNERLGALQSKGKSLSLTELEEFELLMLIQVYRLGQLRKSEGLAEAVRRGLRAPLSA
jgi:hypothetical protein